MPRKKLPVWLIGGIVGDVYFIVIFLFEFALMCHFQVGGMCGFFTAVANLPASLMMPMAFGQSTVMQIVFYLIVNFCLGVLLFAGIRGFWRWQDGH